MRSKEYGQPESLAHTEEETAMSSWVSGSPAAWLCLLLEVGNRACVWMEGGSMVSV